MKCLRDRLSARKPSDILWITDSVGPIDINRLNDLFSKFNLAEWQGKRVGIGSLPIVEYVCSLVFLDGLASSIVLLPPEDDSKTRNARLIEQKIDVVIEGQGIGFERSLSMSVLSDQARDVKETTAFAIDLVQTAWMLPTSGTTGSPKLISHSFHSLTRSMTGRDIGDKYIWGSLYGLRRFAGLQVFLQSWIASTPLILNEDSSDLNIILERFINFNCNALSATPSMWRKLSMHPLFDRLVLKQITLGGEIVDQSVLDLLSRYFPDARITHIYASTEAGVGFSVRDKKSGFPVEYLSNPPLGVPMRIDDQNHLCFSSGTEDNKNSIWIDSGDVVQIVDDRVRFLGRANGSINVGGNKVMPEEIETVIKELSEIAFVQVRARKSAMLGSLVEAAVMLMPGYVLDSNLKRKITELCRARLDGFKVPAFIVNTDAFELNTSGKLSRKIDA